MHRYGVSSSIIRSETPKPEYDIQKILSLTTITTEVRERLLENAGLGKNRMLWDSGKWEEKAQLDETLF